MACARFDRDISFLDMDPMCLLHISQLLELECFGNHVIRNGRDRLAIRIERWPDDEIYVRRIDVPDSPAFRKWSPCCVPGC